MILFNIGGLPEHREWGGCMDTLKLIWMFRWGLRLLWKLYMRLRKRMRLMGWSWLRNGRMRGMLIVLPTYVDFKRYVTNRVGKGRKLTLVLGWRDFYRFDG